LKKEFIYKKDGYIFEYNANHGHINVDGEFSGECYDCIDVGLDFINADYQTFISKCDDWIIDSILRRF
jgi:hypothetical protein